MKLQFGSIVDTRARVLQIAYLRSDGHLGNAVYHRVITFGRRYVSSEPVGRPRQRRGPTNTSADRSAIPLGPIPASEEETHS